MLRKNQSAFIFIIFFFLIISVSAPQGFAFGKKKVPVNQDTETTQNNPQQDQTTWAPGNTSENLYDPSNLNNGTNQANVTTENEDFFGGMNPFEEMDRIHQQMNQIFGESMRRIMNNPQFSQMNNAMYQPDLDFQEAGNTYVLNLDLPGMDKDKIQVEATDEALTISGERKSEFETQNDNAGQGQFYRKERSFGRFQRVVRLPQNAKSDEISAKYANGVLTITVPKAYEQPKTTKSVKVQ